MPTPEEYRKTAESFYRLALEAKTEADRQALLELAKHWLETSDEDNKTSAQAAAAQKSTQ